MADDFSPRQWSVMVVGITSLALLFSSGTSPGTMPPPPSAYPPLAPRRRAQYPLHLYRWVVEASPPDCRTYVARIPPPPPFAPFPPLRAPSPTTTFAPPMTTLHVAAASALHHQRTASAHRSSPHCAPLDGANSTPTPVTGSLPTLGGTLSPWVAQQYKCGPLRLWSRPP